MTDEITKEQALKLIKDLNKDRKELNERINNLLKQNMKIKEKLEQRNKRIIEIKNNLCNLEREMIIILNSNYDYSKIQICEKVLDYQREIEDILNKGVDE